MNFVTSKTGGDVRIGPHVIHADQSTSFEEVPAEVAKYDGQLVSITEEDPFALTATGTLRTSKNGLVVSVSDPPRRGGGKSGGQGRGQSGGGKKAAAGDGPKDSVGAPGGAPAADPEGAAHGDETQPVAETDGAPDGVVTDPAGSQTAEDGFVDPFDDDGAEDDEDQNQ